MLKVCNEYNIPKMIDISSFCSLLYYEFQDTFVDKMEYHKCWEMVFADKGECNIVTEGRCFVLREGELCFHKPYEKHKIVTIKGVHPNIFIISFITSSPAMEFFENKKFAATSAVRQSISQIIGEASGTYESFYNNHHWQGMKPRKDGKLWAGEQTILLRLEIMLIELLRCDRDYLSIKGPIGSRGLINDTLCLAVIDHLEKNVYSKLTMDDISHAVCFSKSYISKRFLKVCGYTVMEYFNYLKIHEAKKLIAESDKNFCEISELLMLSNSHYFSVIFKKYAGMTPTQYKNDCKMHTGS